MRWPRFARPLAAAAALLAGCATPGYQVRVEASGIAPEEVEPLVTRLEATAAEAGGFGQFWTRRDGGPDFPGFSSGWQKVRSGRWRDHDTILVHYLASHRSVTVVVENALRGLEPPIRTELDALGDAFVAEAVACVGAARVEVTRERTSVPLVY